jgi:hypothetical protein
MRDDDVFSYLAVHLIHWIAKKVRLFYYGLVGNRIKNFLRCCAVEDFMLELGLDVLYYSAVL